MTRTIWPSTSPDITPDVDGALLAGGLAEVPAALGDSTRPSPVGQVGPSRASGPSQRLSTPRLSEAKNARWSSMVA
jgi:hypothetical protein